MRTLALEQKTSLVICATLRLAVSMLEKRLLKNLGDVLGRFSSAAPKIECGRRLRATGGQGGTDREAMVGVPVEQIWSCRKVALYHPTTNAGHV